MGPGDLRVMLGGLGPSRSGQVVLEGGHGDDAGAVRLDGDRALLHTVDVITPIVDDPEIFGRIAAANAVSDIYAMAGRPTSAVSILGVPKALPRPVVGRILEAGRALLAECGAHLVGGHTLKDAELRLGFAVTGEAPRRRLATHRGAKAGQLLVLTKPLGTGLLFAAGEALSPAARRAWERSMSTPNRAAGERAQALGIRAATDVTGFGLAGHAAHLARGSGVDLVLSGSALPRLPGVDARLAAGAETGAGRVNRDAYRAWVTYGRVDEATRILASDPQTSGGLLLAVPPRRLSAFADLEHWVVGEVRPPRAARSKVRFVA